MFVLQFPLSSQDSLPYFCPSELICRHQPPCLASSVGVVVMSSGLTFEQQTLDPPTHLLCPPLCLHLTEWVALLTHQRSASVFESLFWERKENFTLTYILFFLSRSLPLLCSDIEALILMMYRDPVGFRYCHLGCGHLLAYQLALVHTPNSIGQSLKTSHFVLATDNPDSNSSSFLLYLFFSSVSVCLSFSASKCQD